MHYGNGKTIEREASSNEKLKFITDWKKVYDYL